MTGALAQDDRAVAARVEDLDTFLVSILGIVRVHPRYAEDITVLRDFFAARFPKYRALAEGAVKHRYEHMARINGATLRMPEEKRRAYWRAASDACPVCAALAALDLDTEQGGER